MRDTKNNENIRQNNRNKALRTFSACLGFMTALSMFGVPVFAAGGTGAAAAPSGKITGDSTEIAGEAMVGTPNPFEDFTTLAGAQNSAGFQLKLPLVVPEGYSNPVYRAIPGEFLEVVWKNAEGDDFRYRKCLASDGDASGDYNDYAVNTTAQVGNVTLQIRGEAVTDEAKAAASGQTAADLLSGTALVHVISGTASDGYSYAMTSSAGITAAELQQLRLGFIEQWLPVALDGETAETAQNLMDTFATRLYDTGISLLYKDDANPSYFFYITLDEDRKVTGVAYLEDGLVQLDAATVQGTAAVTDEDMATATGTTADTGATTNSGTATDRTSLERSMTGNFLDRVRTAR